MILHPIFRDSDHELTGPAIACGPGGCRDVSHIPVPAWTPTPEGARLRHERLERREGLRECAHRIGISAAQLSALEHGQQTLPGEEWMAVLEAARRMK